MTFFAPNLGCTPQKAEIALCLTICYTSSQLSLTSMILIES